MNIDISNEKGNFDALDEIYLKIREIFTNVRPKEDKSIDDLVEIYSNDRDFFNDLKIIGNLMTEIADILEPVEVLEEEYYYFLSIRRMIDYILNEIRLFITHISFIDGLLINFFSLIHQKPLDDEISYQKRFSSFVNNLERQKSFFYKNIFKFNDEYDDLIDEVTNILW